MNDVQKEFKRQMNQGLKDLKKKNKNRYYNYITRNHLDNSEERHNEEVKEKVITVISAPFKILIKLVCFILIIFSIYSVGKIATATNTIKAVNTVPTISVPQPNSNAKAQSDIVNYMNSIQPWINSINNDINLRNKDCNDLNTKLLTSKEYIANITVYRNRISSNLNHFNEIQCPQELLTFRSMTVQQYNELLRGIDFEIQYMNSGNSSIRNQAISCFNNSNDIGKNVQKETNNTLIKYKLKQQ